MSKLAYPNVAYQWKSKVPKVNEQLLREGFNPEREDSGIYFVTIRINKPSDWSRVGIAEEIIQQNNVEYYLDGTIPTNKGEATMYLVMNYKGFYQN